MDTINLTLAAGLVLALLVLATLFNKLGSGLQDRSTLLLALAGYVGVAGAFLLVDPSKHLGSLNDLTQIAWVAGAFLLLPLAWENNRTPAYGLITIAAASLVGAVGTKAAELSKPGEQHDLHVTNIWLLITGALCLIAYFRAVTKERRKAKLITTSHTSTTVTDGPTGNNVSSSTQASSGPVHTITSLRKQEP